MTTDETQDETTVIEAPLRVRPRWRRWWAILFYVLVVLVVGVRVALPYVLRRVIETQGEAFLAGKVKVAVSKSSNGHANGHANGAAKTAAKAETKKPKAKAKGKKGPSATA